MGSSWAFVPIASSSRLIAIRQFDVPINFDPIPSHIACTHQSCQRKLWRLLVPKSAILILSKDLSLSIFSHNFVIALAYKTCNSKRPIFFNTDLDLNSVNTDKTGTSQNITSAHLPSKLISNCPSFFLSSYSGNLSFSNQSINDGRNIARLP